MEDTSDGAQSDPLITLPADELLDALRLEVRGCRDWVQGRRRPPLVEHPMCPFHSFDRTRRTLEHIRRYHVRDRVCNCPGGSKQLRVVMALWDFDSTRGRSAGTDYLRRSAVVMRSTIRPALPSSAMGPRSDRQVRLVLHSFGSYFANLSRVRLSKTLRR